MKTFKMTKIQNEKQLHNTHPYSSNITLANELIREESQQKSRDT